jgi:hypothetical protein
VAIYVHPPPTLRARKGKFAPKLRNLFDPILNLMHREHPATLLSKQLNCVQYICQHPSYDI